jgi:hypothetical protein
MAGGDGSLSASLPEICFRVRQSLFFRQKNRCPANIS